MRLQRAYLYLVSLVSLLAFVFGLVSLASGLIYLGLAPDRPPTGAVGLLSHPDVLPWLIWTLVAALLWAAHWFLANRVARTLTMAGATERNAPIRKAYLYLGQLVLLVLLGAQATLMLYNVLLALLGQPAADLTPWPAHALAPAVGTAVALAFWIYLRRVTLSDGDFGHELGAARGWRRGYFHSGIALATVVAAAGAGEFLRTFLRVAGQIYSFGIQPGEPDVWRRLGAASLAAALVAFPAVITLWRKTNRIAAESDGAEVNAVDRKLLIYGGRAAGAAVTLVSLGFLLWQILLIVLGQFPVDARVFWEDQLAPVLGYLPVGLIVWIFFSSAGRGDIAWVEESRESAVLRRIYYYLMAALGLAAFWYGVQALFVLLLLLVLRIWPPSLLLTEQARRFFSLTAVLALVGGPVWWAHWRPQHALAREEGPVGFEERGSMLRRIYLYLVAAVGAVVAVFSLGVVLYQTPGWLFGPGSTVNFVQSVVQFGVAITMALIWWIAHGIVLRGDQRRLAEDAAALEISTAVPDVQEATREAGAGTQAIADAIAVPPLPVEDEEPPAFPVTPPPAPAATPPSTEPAGRVRRFQRDTLRSNLRVAGLPAASPSEAPLAPDPPGTTGEAKIYQSPPALPIGTRKIVIVVDSGDGALGRDLLAALRQAVPEATLWPLAFNAVAYDAMLEALGTSHAPPMPHDALAEAAVILGPSDMVAPGGLSEEVPAELAAAMAASPAHKVLLPPKNPRLHWVAAPDWPQERWVGYAVAEVVQVLRS